MLGWAVTFLVIALIAAVFGFAGIAGAAAGIAQILFYIFLVIFHLPGDGTDARTNTRMKPMRCIPKSQTWRCGPCGTAAWLATVAGELCQPAALCTRSCLCTNTSNVSFKALHHRRISQRRVLRAGR